MKALNRKEVLVNAKANGTLDSFKPLTRDEAFTKKALGLGGGASSWNDLTDKPFGVIREAEIVTIFEVENPTYYYDANFDLTYAYGYFSDRENVLKSGEVYNVVINGNRYNNKVAYSFGPKNKQNGIGGDVTEGYPFYVYDNGDGGMSFNVQIPGNNPIESVIIEWSVAEDVDTLDIKYLPEQLQFGKMTRIAPLMEMTTINISEQGFADVTVGPVFTVDAEYEVVWDGIPYQVVAKPMDDIGNYLGNPSLDNFGSDNGVPFLIISGDYGTGAYFDILGESGEHTVEITGEVPFVKTLDAEYLPALTSPNGTKYKIIVSDDGTLSATSV